MTPRIQYTMFKNIAMCIERTTALRANNRRITRGEVKACLVYTSFTISLELTERKAQVAWMYAVEGKPGGC